MDRIVPLHRTRSPGNVINNSLIRAREHSLKSDWPRDGINKVLTQTIEAILPSVIPAATSSRGWRQIKRSSDKFTAGPPPGLSKEIPRQRDDIPSPICSKRFLRPGGGVLLLTAGGGFSPKACIIPGRLLWDKRSARRAPGLDSGPCYGPALANGWVGEKKYDRSVGKKRYDVKPEAEWARRLDGPSDEVLDYGNYDYYGNGDAGNCPRRVSRWGEDRLGAREGGDGAWAVLPMTIQPASVLGGDWYCQLLLSGSPMRDERVSRKNNSAGLDEDVRSRHVFPGRGEMRRCRGGVCRDVLTPYEEGINIMPAHTYVVQVKTGLIPRPSNLQSSAEIPGESLFMAALKGFRKPPMGQPRTISLPTQPVSGATANFLILSGQGPPLTCHPVAMDVRNASKAELHKYLISPPARTSSGGRRIDRRAWSPLAPTGTERGAGGRGRLSHRRARTGGPAGVVASRTDGHGQGGRRVRTGGPTGTDRGADGRGQGDRRARRGGLAGVVTTCADRKDEFSFIILIHKKKYRIQT
uniref:Uncharacterized protein n=1 Tax=Branchiostoma floridae TaxID=7739 RepID=C3YP75_BRAFL|eukprot:XP_002601954.1 hypothetical protein BRAFLDRAFT_86438 [Branchiostoma floridae]